MRHYRKPVVDPEIIQGFLLTFKINLHTMMTWLFKKRLMDWLTGFFINNPRSKILNLVWAIATICLWLSIFHKKPDLLFSCLVGVIGFYAVMPGLTHVWPPLKDRLVRLGFSVGLMTSFIYTSVLAGDFGTAGQVPYVCFGRTHLHHWAKYLILSGALISIPFMAEQIKARRQWSYLAFSTAGILSMAAALSLIGTDGFYGNKSFCIEAIILSVFLSGTAVLVLSKEVISRDFKIFMAISLGGCIGIFLNGTVGIIREIVFNPREIPRSLIFFNDPTCEP